MCNNKKVALALVELVATCRIIDEFDEIIEGISPDPLQKAENALHDLYGKESAELLIRKAIERIEES